MINQKRKLKKARTKVKSFTSVLLLISVILFTLFLIISNLRLQARRSEVLSAIADITKEINELEEQKQVFQAKISQQEFQYFLEKEARERFGLKRPGEQVVVIVEPEQELPPVESLEQDKGFWQKFFEFFFHF